MLAILTRTLTIVFASLALALAIYYRAKVAPRLPPDLTQRLPGYMRAGADGPRLTIVLLAVIIIIFLAAQVFLLFSGEPITTLDVLSPVAFAGFDIALLITMVRLRGRMTG